LDSVETVLERIKAMTWKGNHPTVHFLDKVYERGVKLTKKEMKSIQYKLYRNTTLARWDVAILG